MHHRKPACHNDPEAGRTGVSREFVQRIKSSIGLNVNVLVDPANSLEQSVGKSKRVVDRRNVP
jgi:phenylacetate-coenzyme A ligase PaaK-like adenylate-forming protein